MQRKLRENYSDRTKMFSTTASSSTFCDKDLKAIWRETWHVLAIDMRKTIPYYKLLSNWCLEKLKYFFNLGPFLIQVLHLENSVNSIIFLDWQRFNEVVTSHSCHSKYEHFFLHNLISESFGPENLSIEHESMTLRKTWKK